MSDLKRTPLFEIHRSLGARLAEFGGWEMPIQYTSIMDEHQAVRTAAGLFDVSHMGEVKVSGPSAESFLDEILTNDLSKLEAGSGHYTVMCNERGGVIDDLYAYRISADSFLLMINASRIAADVAWITRRFENLALMDGTSVIDESARTGALAVQGPKTVEFIDAVFADRASEGVTVKRPTELKKNQVAVFQWSGDSVLAARTGYTGEDGFELVAPAPLIAELWNRIREAGKVHGLKPAGLGARDTLRMEMGYPLYGHELDEDTTPIEAGLGWTVGFGKPQFVGRETLELQKTNGVRKKCMAFKMTEKSAPPRAHYPICSEGSDSAVIGEVVSGTQSPSLGIGIGMGYVPPEFSKPGTKVRIEIRGKRYSAEVARRPLYKKAV